ncbi:MAG: hypothetical protein U1E36_00800 [Rickettsiales bacterium]
MAQAALATKEPAVTDAVVAEEAHVKDTLVTDVQSELQQRLAAYHSPTVTAKPENILNGRYRIDPNRGLDYGYTHAKACHAEDTESPERPLMAVICDHFHPYRPHVLDKMRQADHPNLLKLVDAGVVKISNLRQERFVIIYEKPQAKSLGQMLRDGAKFTEAQCIQQIIKPLTQALMFFEENGLSHLRVNPDNIFMGENLLLGDAIAEPAGFSQPFLYEPIERLMCSPFGKGDGNIRSDTYAVGVIITEALYGLEKQKKLTKEEFTSMVIQHGAIGVMLGNRTHTEYFQDFFRGTLTDNAQERWYASTMRSWLGGKRFNLLSTNSQREALRSIEFEGKEYFSRRALAHAFFENWPAARHFVPDGKLPRWLDQSLLKPDFGGRMGRAIDTYKGAINKTERAQNELLARAIMILDPQGPVRLGKASFSVDGLGQYLSECFQYEMQAELQLIAEAIAADLHSFWAELQPPQATEMQDLVWKIQKLRGVIHSRHVGFGMERCLYELNPHIPCLSPLVREYHTTNLKDLLQVLDAIAPTKGANDSFLDRHLAAFLTAKLGVFKNAQVKEVQDKEELSHNDELKIIRMIAKAQERTGLKLPGLTMWVAQRVLNLVGHIHSRRFRQNIIGEIKRYVDEGSVSYVLQVFFNEKIMGQDNSGFQQAWTVFQKNKSRILRLKNRETVRKKARETGTRMASFVATLMLLYALYYVFQHYLR